MILKKLKQLRERKLRKFCIEQAVKASNGSNDVVGDAIVFEQFLKCGASDLISFDQKSRDIYDRHILNLKSKK